MPDPPGVSIEGPGPDWGGSERVSGESGLDSRF